MYHLSKILPNITLNLLNILSNSNQNNQVITLQHRYVNLINECDNFQLRKNIKTYSIRNGTQAYDNIDRNENFDKIINILNKLLFNYDNNDNDTDNNNNSNNNNESDSIPASPLLNTLEIMIENEGIDFDKTKGYLKYVTLFRSFRFFDSNVAAAANMSKTHHSNNCDNSIESSKFDSILYVMV